MSDAHMIDAALEEIDPTPATTDAALNAWNESTKNCSSCKRIAGLRTLCAGCRESMPRAAPGLKHQQIAAQGIPIQHAMREKYGHRPSPAMPVEDKRISRTHCGSRKVY